MLKFHLLGNAWIPIARQLRSPRSWHTLVHLNYHKRFLEVVLSILETDLNRGRKIWRVQGMIKHFPVISLQQPPLQPSFWGMMPSRTKWVVCCQWILSTCGIMQDGVLSQETSCSTFFLFTRQYPMWCQYSMKIICNYHHHLGTVRTSVEFKWSWQVFGVPIATGCFISGWKDHIQVSSIAMILGSISWPSSLYLRRSEWAIFTHGVFFHFWDHVGYPAIGDLSQSECDMPTHDLCPTHKEFCYIFNIFIMCSWQSPFGTGACC